MVGSRGRNQLGFLRPELALLLIPIVVIGALTVWALSGPSDETSAVGFDGHTDSLVNTYSTGVDQLLVVGPASLDPRQHGLGDDVTVRILVAPAHGTLTLIPGGGFVYQPKGGFVGTDAFQIEMSDGDRQVTTIAVVEVAGPADGSSALSGATDGSETSDEAAADGTGAAVYAASCAGCHGANGEGGAGPALAGTSLDRSTVDSATRNGKGTMPGFASQLSEEELTGVVNYVLSLGGDGSTTTTLAGGASGSAIYASKCAGCHGSSGQGGAGPAIAGLSS
ncbi:MAG: c-type cytochrome, partial [Acidimicrobiia bacterium]|nr:c-type cytochrome [Acidimicrobiia bacterium]